MERRISNKKKGFALLELLIVVVIISGLAALVIPRVLKQVEKAKVAEAVTNLGAIRSAELLLHSLTGQFAAADDKAGIESVLGLSFKEFFYNYKIIGADQENFLAIATPLGLLENWLEEVKMDKDGFVVSSQGDDDEGGSGGSGGSGGGGSGSSGGGGSGGSGGGSGGSGSGNNTTVSGGTIASSDVTSVHDSSGKVPFEGYAEDEQEVIDTLLLSLATLTSDGATTGKALAEFIQDNEISITFVAAEYMPVGCKMALGCHEPFDDGTSKIYILSDYKGNKYAAAAILGHEALHAVWWKDYAEYFYLNIKPEPTIGMPIPDGGIRSDYSRDQEYNTKKAGGEIWLDLRTQYPTLVEDEGNLWQQLAADEKYFVGVPEDEAKGYLTSVYKYEFEHEY